MKIFVSIILITLFLFNCNTSKTIGLKKNEHTENIKQNDTVKIANAELEYEIIIIDPGFSGWLASMAKPEGYYSQSYLENRNFIYVTEWNQRVNQPQQYNPNLYEMSIDYQSNIDYGYDVNYKLYNYFIYFQLTYKQQLAGFVPRI
ncbi:hypothetical protein APS56_00680 [Pseudalgibacter alginicilyticus]|uniref:Uncharacterized protein n=1 Tax=Pseudalgibacter alginicilyticus TaxID=1736674 RepID=A0A0P0CD25_9FLAO|nr:DUF6146 family protein [Pseudalgibacter alginicilyticus]ALJ03753.1 hypothetical protein APS56_00680 [Pseudalgibacter alginicilyticus]